MSILITGALAMGGEAITLAIKDGVFVPADDLAGDASVQTIDAGGLVALPGLVDLHTHLRQPGMEQAETVLTGSQAAAAGGFTAVHAMANTQPVADLAGVTDLVHRLGRQAGYVDVRPVGAVTRGLAGEELAGIGGMARGQAQVRVFSDDGHCVHDSLVMRRAMEYVATFDGVIAQHAQDPRLTEDAQINEGALSATLGMAGWPSVAEEAIIARDVLLARYTGARLHVCHVSTEGSIDLIRYAKKRGIPVTAEVTPHHLLLTDELTANYDPLFKVNPPLRGASDVQALREAVADGTIDIIATDHAPHPTDSKDCAFNEAAFGMLGLESALRVVHKTLVAEGHLTWEQVARVMSSQPATIGRLAGYQQPLTIGSPAHVTLYDPTGDHPVDMPHTKSTNNPYRDITLPGRLMTTVFGGVVTVLNGDISDPDQVANGKAMV
jgi:dihydroorotase